jgi:hypothetical protein
MKTNNNIYYTAFYGIAYDRLYTAFLLPFEKMIFPTSQVQKNAKGTYDYIRAPRSQEFIDAILNDQFSIVGDSTEKLSIVLKENEVVVCSDGQLMVAFSRRKSALDYATKQLYENLDSFRTPKLVSYEINE